VGRDSGSTKGVGRDSGSTKGVGRDSGSTKGVNSNSAAKTHGGTTKGVAANPESTKNVAADPASAAKTHGSTTKGVAAQRRQTEGRTKGRLNTGVARTGTSGTRHQLSEEHVLPPETVLQGRYTIETVLGIGGMSVVYRGRDMRFKDVVRSCAIKEMYQRSPDSQTRMLSLQFFEREAGMLATLNHPAIPKVYDFFEENGRVYLVLELVSGHDLETILEENGEPLNEREVGNWAIQICDVLQYLHGYDPEPIVFRDMKPSNVMLTDDNRIVLVDFGIARLLDPSNRKGTMIGTEGYASPEQFRGIALPASDIYSLGATLHQLLSGSDPRGETPFTFHERPLRAMNPSVSAEMEAVVTRALEYDIEGRWGSTIEFKQALLSVPSIASTMPAARSMGAGAPLPGIAADPSTSTELLWSFACEDEVRSSPRVNSGLVLIGSYDTNLYAIDAERGEFRWKYATEGGISSTPDVWQELVVIGSEDGIVYGLDIHRGKMRWRFRTEKAVRSSPRVEDRVIFVGSDDQHFYAIDGMRGTILWKYRTWMPIRSTACINEAMVYMGGDDGNAYCLDVRNGGLRWKQRTQRAIRTRPIYDNGFVFVGSMDNNLYALDSQGGWPAWRFRTGHSINSSPCVLGTRVFVGSADGNMYALEIKNGRLSWKYEVGSQIVSSPCVENGRLYFGSVDGNMYCLDASTGSLIWKYQTEAPIISSPSVVDGVVYVGSLDHNVYALKA
jgi:outer membrane protein assembly factor BamB/tRNA A-37 threonylcarbamoyl transferase component Bud32